MKLFKYLLCISLVIFLTGCREKIFYLEEKYYEKSSIEDISVNSLEQLIDNKESFALFVYQPLCENSSNLENLLNEFINNYQMSFYKIKFADIKDENLGKKIKYYPSFVIYKDGKVVDYLESDSNEDINKFKNLNDFKTWLSSYVELGKQIINENKNLEENTDISEEEMIKDIKLDDISYDENKVNIYMFWGNGCPHCEQEMKFFKSIEEEYGQYFTLNRFEVWYNEDNVDIYSRFAEKMGDKPTGVPYTIIGNKTFRGFNHSREQDIIQAIITQYKNSYDVYFDN